MRILRAVALWLAVCGLAFAAPIYLTNPGFESGNLYGWMATGLASATGSVTTAGNTIDPYAGTYMATLATGGSVTPGALETFFGLASGTIGVYVPGPNNGSGIYQDFSGSAGDVLTVYYNFAAGDYAPYNDTGFVFVRSPIGLLFQNLGCTTSGCLNIVGDYGTSGWQAFSYTLPVSGSFRIGLGTVNEADNLLTSRFHVDSRIPEPAAFTFLGLGLALIGLRRLRRSS